MMLPDPMQRWAEQPNVSDTTLQNLASDYLTIERVAGNSDALSVDAFLPPEYDPKTLIALMRVADNIIELDLSGLPLGQEEMDLIASYSNLEWLEVDRTPIKDIHIKSLKNLSKLHTLKVYDTDIGDPSIEIFEKLESLQKLFLWKTGVSKLKLDNLHEKRPELMIEDGALIETSTASILKDSMS